MMRNYWHGEIGPWNNGARGVSRPPPYVPTHKKKHTVSQEMGTRNAGNSVAIKREESIGNCQSTSIYMGNHNAGNSKVIKREVSIEDCISASIPQRDTVIVVPKKKHLNIRDKFLPTLSDFASIYKNSPTLCNWNSEYSTIKKPSPKITSQHIWDKRCNNMFLGCSSPGSAGKSSANEGKFSSAGDGHEIKQENIPQLGEKGPTVHSLVPQTPTHSSHASTITHKTQDHCSAASFLHAVKDEKKTVPNDALTDEGNGIQIEEASVDEQEQTDEAQSIDSVSHDSIEKRSRSDIFRDIVDSMEKKFKLETEISNYVLAQKKFFPDRSSEPNSIDKLLYAIYLSLKRLPFRVRKIAEYEILSLAYRKEAGYLHPPPHRAPAPSQHEYPPYHYPPPPYRYRPLPQNNPPPSDNFHRGTYYYGRPY